MNDDKNGLHLSMTQSTERLDEHSLDISKETLSNGYEYTKIINHNTVSKRRKLILHFDNRNTLQVNFLLFVFFTSSFFYLIRLRIMYRQQQSNKVCKKIN